MCAGDAGARVGGVVFPGCCAARNGARLIRGRYIMARAEATARQVWEEAQGRGMQCQHRQSGWLRRTVNLHSASAASGPAAVAGDCATVLRYGFARCGGAKQAVPGKEQLLFEVRRFSYSV